MTHAEFIDAVLSQTDLSDRGAAERLVEATLRTFSDILYRTERDALSAPLPKSLAHFVHAARPESSRKEVERLAPEEFLNRVQARADIGYPEAKALVPVVMQVFGRAVGRPIVEDVADRLPHTYSVLFPFVQSVTDEGPPPA